MISNLKSESFPRVAVLLAAYNGVEWIEEQVDTVLSQKNININIFISVDLSDDNTFDLCSRLEEGNNLIKVLPYGEYFGGAAKNFYRLIRDINFKDFDYISFSDQDDLWLPNKLSRAVNILQDDCIEAYSSDVIAFWSDGRERLVKKSYPQKKFDHYFESPGAGCTYLFKKKSAELLKIFIIKNWESVNNIESHDWFFYAFFRSRNMNWCIDNKALMLYRQHEKNQVGSNFGFSAYLKRISMVKSGWYYSEVNKILKLVDKCDGENFKLDTWFLVKNIYQLRRRNRDVIILLFVIIFQLF
jgi:rhamnosyltransferase